MKEVSNITNSLAHTKWNCKYHIVFAPKYRRKVFYEEKRLEIREILRKLCQWKGVDIIEGEICPDHIHMLVSMPPKMSVSGFMGYLKGKSSLMIFQKWGNMKFAYRNREFWCKGYYVDTSTRPVATLQSKPQIYTNSTASFSLMQKEGEKLPLLMCIRLWCRHASLSGV